MCIRDFENLNPISDYIHSPNGELLDMSMMTSDHQEYSPFADACTTDLEFEEMLKTTEEEGMETFDPMTSAEHVSRVAFSSVFTSVGVGFP